MNSLNEAYHMMNHELRRPLANVMGVLNLVKTENAPYSRLNEHIELLESAIKQLDRAIIICQKKIEEDEDGKALIH